MILRHIQFGENRQPLVILHGFLGSSKNWYSVAKELCDEFQVYLLDQRNHGTSFHSENHRISDLIQDLKNWLKHHQIEKPILLGHSMGGLVASGFSLHYPDLISRLIVVDIAPRNYQLNYEQELKALSMDLSQFKSRSAIDEAMSKFLVSKKLRQFLQTNIIRVDGNYQWTLNVDALKKPRGQMDLLNIEGEKMYNGKTLFIRGEASDFMNDADELLIKNYFPNSEIITILQGDHWLHYSHFNVFIKVVKTFLER